ncbi:histone-like nucleoid-structuring protein Lsr2 [Blastococcus tunisiensis]|uniref:Lsr2 protein n=1 Tax=Blastococcus tunisiensis TaxID=1798228 RepID=A0A1I2EME6_9ACTN|nr:Lsr2 family protein [Blastococcus sp. DSM 46838]SFE93893.1 Lsr2 protein [Blastococcus sp. DSM 46838]
MAQKTKVVLVDDLTGEVLPDGQGQTVSFALEGTSYEIDLNKDDADALRQVFQRYVAAGRKVGRQPVGRRGARARDTAVIRTWARENGHNVSERGRIPSAVVEAYEAAN